MKIFEQKFKGSLEKLDEFEKEWSDFKVQHVATGVTAVVSNLPSTRGKEDIQMRIQESFDAG